MPKAKFPPPYQFKFRAGPYRPPSVNVGAKLLDLHLGEVQVEGVTKAPIPWPGANYNRGRHEGLLPILCGDLVRAVCEEDENTVAHYWGVTRHMVNEWKKKTPLRRMAKLEEITDGVLFIIENDFFNGRVLELDGGLRI